MVIKISVELPASSGISTSLNTITIANHDYESGEIVKYTAEDTAIGGLTSGTEYYISKVDNNNFHLSEIGTGSVAKEFYYNTDQFVDFTTTGSGTHSFNYQDISVSVVGRLAFLLSALKPSRQKFNQYSEVKLHPFISQIRV